MRKSIIAILILIIIAIGGFLLFHTFLPSQKTSDSTNTVTKSTVTNFLTHTNKSLLSHSGSPVFTITSLSQPEKGWYIVNIQAKDISSPLGKIVLNAPNGIKNAYIVVGPESSFSSQELSNYQIPESVKKGIME